MTDAIESSFRTESLRLSIRSLMDQYGDYEVINAALWARSYREDVRAFEEAASKRVSESQLGDLK